MKEFIEKLIARLEELKDDVVDDKCPVEKNSLECEKEYACETCYLTKAINIVNELAEEYNNGWTPCSERLPEGNKGVLVCTNAGQIDVDYYGEYIKDFIGLKGTEQYAIAWQPLPQPYKEEGAKNESNS